MCIGRVLRGWWYYLVDFSGFYPSNIAGYICKAAAGPSIWRRCIRCMNITARYMSEIVYFWV
jgi:hypothetical protein